MLDTLETDAFLEVINNNSWADEFDDFDLFFNNIANYHVTRNSKASYLTGMFYHNGELEDWWGERYAEGVFRQLSEEKFQNWTYAPLTNKSWQHRHADVFRSNFDIYREHMGEPQAESYDFLKVWLISLNSMPSYLSGTLYHSGDLIEWRDTSASTLFGNLRERGFRIWEYAPFEYWPSTNVDAFLTNLNVYRTNVDVLDAELYEFLKVWILSLTPNTETNEAVAIAPDLADYLFTLLTTGWWAEEQVEKHDPRWQNRVSKSDFHRYASVLLLEQVLQDETLRTPSCHYVYAHAVIPHSPFVLDGRCRYVGEREDRPQAVGVREAYLQQAECSIHKVIGFLRELKRLGRYDDAAVLLHADTGDWLHILGGQDAEVLGLQRAKLLGKVRALLMIKRPHARHPLERIEIPTQLVDIYPTLLDMLGIEEPQRVHGRSVYASAAHPRDARFALDPDEPFGPDLIEVRIDDPMNVATSSLTVLGPATDPNIWRAEIKRANGQAGLDNKRGPSSAMAPEADRLTPATP